MSIADAGGASAGREEGNLFVQTTRRFRSLLFTDQIVKCSLSEPCEGSQLRNGKDKYRNSRA